MTDDYGRIERALTFIATHVDEQPELERIAAEVGVSAFHLQRLFTRWAGVSPKKFLQYLSLDRAKEALATGSGVLEAAYAGGLSGPGRLHDLFIAHEAVTPGEFKRRGEGLTISYGWAESPFGDCLIMTTPRGICGLAFTQAEGRDACFADMTARWPQARFVEDAAAVRELAPAIFAADGPARERLRLVLYGTPWQIKVWEALLQIPPSALVCYEDIAGKVFGGRAARAVGTAVGANPISYLIPCHRVIRKSGVISHYHWGRPRKVALIGWEAAAAERQAGLVPA
jgi:AraC family transcriptional regulator, regulatory protein of adaptative response / methylated-DNA-[protein]-cysteine methyltransferase